MSLSEHFVLNGDFTFYMRDQGKLETFKTMKNKTAKEITF